MHMPKTSKNIIEQPHYNQYQSVIQHTHRPRNKKHASRLSKGPPKDVSLHTNICGFSPSNHQGTYKKCTWPIQANTSNLSCKMGTVWWTTTWWVNQHVFLILMGTTDHRGPTKPGKLWQCPEFCFNCELMSSLGFHQSCESEGYRSEVFGRT